MKKESISTEDFLKAIFHFEEEGKAATSGNLAAVLGITPAAITDMSKKLSRSNHIIYEPYKALHLTQKGREIAVGVIRRHRLWEAFLHDILEMDWRRIHDEAERLEHQTSDYLLNKLDAFLGFPSFDPHGDPIPDGDGQFPDERALIPLKNVKDKGSYQILRILSHGSEKGDFLQGLGLETGQEIRLERPEQGGGCLITFNDQKIVLPVEYAGLILVKTVE